MSNTPSPKTAQSREESYLDGWEAYLRELAAEGPVKKPLNG